MSYSARFVMNDYQCISSVSNMILDLSWDTLEHIDELNLDYVYFIKYYMGSGSNPSGAEYIKPLVYA